MTLSSLSAVVVIENEAPHAGSLTALSDALARFSIDSEIIIVANGVDDTVGRSIRAAMADVSDTTCLFLAGRIDTDQARLVALENTVGDFAFLCRPAADHIAALRPLVDAAHDGWDVVLGESASAGRRASVASRTFYWLYKVMRGIAADPSSAQAVRLISRPAALFIINQLDGEMLLKARSLNAGFSSTSIVLPDLDKSAPPKRPFWKAWSKAFRILIGATTMPLRLASLASLTAGILSILYSIYVVIIYFSLPDVERGWTTLSLQLAGMMLLFSIVLLFLSEYIVQIHASNPPRSRRFLISREVRSAHTRRAQRLNVIDEAGSFKLGAPDKVPFAGAPADMLER